MDIFIGYEDERKFLFIDIVIIFVGFVEGNIDYLSSFIMKLNVFLLKKNIWCVKWVNLVFVMIEIEKRRYKKY